ncbi:secretory calcium-binding phosphoprotein 1 [Cheilinus undulatus]|uniref:secretory calcium-binding phosphoprotein 1 n=1 Tax=Cheilinus undulatus TaxID=241271 RepID=UPI001BD42A25|nr:secretory calcium-binding phosphoprotein 1 [Cheilinus undulatus]
MKFIIFTFFLIGAVFASPTESLSVSQSSENDTSELQSSEENISSLSSESQSDESTSEDTTSEESNSESEEDNGSDSLAETRDDSMGSEENVRKRVQVFASVLKVLSAEDNSSTEVKSLSTEVTEKQQKTNLAQGHTDLQLVDSTSDSSDSTSESADTSDSTEETAATSDSSESKESNETNETSEDSDSASRSEEDSNASDSAELEQVKDCVNGTQSCESEEYFFSDIGDDAHYSVDNLMVPDDGEREFMLRR